MSKRVANRRGPSKNKAASRLAWKKQQYARRQAMRTSGMFQKLFSGEPT